MGRCAYTLRGTPTGKFRPPSHYGAVRCRRSRLEVRVSALRPPPGCAQRGHPVKRRGTGQRFNSRRQHNGLEELETLFGIGEATAGKIVTFRKENGPFESWDELEEIPGIRNSIISRLRKECAL